MRELAALMAIVWWLAGIALSKGWLMLAAVIVPPYAWYVVVERVLQMAGVV